MAFFLLSVSSTSPHPSFFSPLFFCNILYYISRTAWLTHKRSMRCTHTTHIFIAPGSVSVLLSDTSGGGQRFDRRQWAVALQRSRNLRNNNCNEGIIWQLHGYDNMRFSANTHTHARTQILTHSIVLSRGAQKPANLSKCLACYTWVVRKHSQMHF